MSNKEQKPGDSQIINKVLFGDVVEIEVDTTAGGTIVVPENPSRKGLYITNSTSGGSQTAYLAFGVDPVSQKTIALDPGGTFFMTAELLTTQEIKMITQVGNTDITYQEAT